MKKKLVSVLLGAAMALSVVLSGCGGTDNAAAAAGGAEGTAAGSNVLQPESQVSLGRGADPQAR